MIGDVVWSDNRAWTQSTSGQWSGYYPGSYANMDMGWAFHDLVDLQISFDFRWIVREGKYLLADPKLEDTFERLDSLWDGSDEDAADILIAFRVLAAELLDVGLDE